VSQRVAAHRRRKGAQGNDGEPPAHGDSSGSVRLSGAAARVAARYATAPSYSDLFAQEISSAPNRVEPPAEQIMLLDLGAASAEVPSQAPLSHSPASHLSSIQETSQLIAPVEQPHTAPVEATTATVPVWEPDWDFGNDRLASTQHPLSEALERASHRGEWAADWAADEPAPTGSMAHAEAPASARIEDEHQAIWMERAESSYAETQEDFVVDAQPIHGNLIEFPHELVAARKVRPRRAEGIYGAVTEAEPQLSIFEVDPSSISIRPDAVEQPAEAPAWTRPEWADMKLEASQQKETVAEPVVEVRQSKAVELQAAPMNLRMLAAVVDFGLVSIMFLTVALLVAVNSAVLPSLREAEIDGGLMFAAIAIAYLAFSFTVARATPGMKYALISLRTFDGLTPTREQRCRRLGAMALSMLPVGLGAVWALFDDEHLSWHDRWSGTYLRRV
jgi:uncharacterized RDD family membrane protein YckC